MEEKEHFQSKERSDVELIDGEGEVNKQDLQAGSPCGQELSLQQAW